MCLRRPRVKPVALPPAASAAPWRPSRKQPRTGVGVPGYTSFPCLHARSEAQRLPRVRADFAVGLQAFLLLEGGNGLLRARAEYTVGRHLHVRLVQGDLERLDAVAPHERLGQTQQRRGGRRGDRSEEHTYELQSLMRISYAVFSLKKTKQH